MLSKKLLETLLDRTITKIDPEKGELVWYTLEGDTLDSFIKTNELGIRCKDFVAEQGQYYMRSGSVLVDSVLIHECYLYKYNNPAEQESFVGYCEADAIFEACNFLGY